MNVHSWLKTSLGLVCSLGIGLSALPIAPVQAQTDRFNDVSDDYWASDYIEALAGYNILSGFPDGSFRPDEPVTRAQFAAILRQAFLKSQAADGELFSDVSADYWGADAIRAARSGGFLAGYPGNVFRPEVNIPRVQAFVALTNGLDYDGDDEGILSYYEDASEIPDYALSQMTAATEAQLVVNHPVLTQLNPNRNATRAEVAAFIYQTMVREELVSSLPNPPYVVTQAGVYWQREPVAKIPINPEQISFSASGKRLVTRTEAGDSIEVWNTETGERVVAIEVEEGTRVDAVALNETGTQVARIVQTKKNNKLELQLWDLENDRRVWRESLGTIKTSADRDEDSFLESAATVAFSPGDGGILTQVNLDADRTQEAGVIQLRYHERATGDLLHSLTPASGLKLDGFEFSPDGKLLASTGYFGDDSQAIEVWQLDTGDLLNTFEFERGEFWLSEMTFTSNETLKTLSRNPIANVYLDTWNVRSGERIDRISTLPGVDRQDRIGVFSPGGRYYFIRSDVGGTYIIDTQTSTATNLDIYVSQIAEFNATGDYLALESNEDLQIFKRVTP